MRELFNFKNKKFAVYGLGLTGKSAVSFLKKNKANKIYTWDDFLNNKSSKYETKFKNSLSIVDYIVLSPGINIKRSKFKRSLFKNRKKIISDLDLFFLKNKIKRSIIITGTNGKSTTCALIHHVLKKNKIRNELVGNIGKPILNSKFLRDTIYIIEASSFQLEYSKFLKPYCAAILNISKDHLDWHGSRNKYSQYKLKIFNNQSKNYIAFLNDSSLKKIYKKNNYLGNLKFIKKNFIKIKETNNNYLQLEANKENLNFAYFITKVFNINKKKFLNSIESFKGLEHRHEIFFKFYNYTFINDSKATSFESTSYALKSNKNIIWIVGGQPKKNDKINIKKFKNKIYKAFVIGKHNNFFVQQIKNKIKFEITKTLTLTVSKIFRSFQRNKDFTVLLSPASASYDQFKNFVDRGEKFKNLVKNHAKKFN